MAGKGRSKRKRRSKGSSPDGGAKKDSIPESSSGQTPKDKRRKRRLAKELRTHSITDDIENKMLTTARITTGTEVHDAVNGILTDKSAYHATIINKTTSKGKEDYQSIKTKNQHQDNRTTIHDAKSNLEVAERSTFHKKPGQASRSDNQTTTLLTKENFSKTDNCKDNQTRGEKANEVSVGYGNNSSALTLKYQHDKKRCKKSNRKTEGSSNDDLRDSHNYESNNTPMVLSTSNEKFSGKDDIRNVKATSTAPEIDLDLNVPNPAVKVKRSDMKKRKKKMRVTNYESSNTPVVLSPTNEIFPGKDEMINVKVSSTTPEIELDLNVPKPAVKVKCSHKKKKKSKMLDANYESSNVPVVLSTSNEIVPGKDDMNIVKVSSMTPEIELDLNVPKPAVKVKCSHKKKKKSKMLDANYESSNVPVVLSTSNEIVPEKFSGKDNIRNVKATSTAPEIDLDLDVPKPAVKVKHRHRKKKKNKLTNCASTSLPASIQNDDAEKGLCSWSSNVGSAMKIHDKGVNCLELSVGEENNASEDAYSNSNKSEMSIEINLLPVVASSNIIKDQSKNLQSSTPDIQRTVLHCPQKKLLVLDLNGLLADINPDYRVKADKRIGGKAVFKRPFCHEFLKFCFEKFNIGVWSSRKRQNVDAVVEYVMGNFRHKLLFCWDQSKCTNTGQKTLENRHKPLVLKELSKLWNKEDDDLPWEKGEYQPSNTLLVDDSPYKAICNPPHTAIFPFPYNFRMENDNSLGPQGDLRCYLEGLAMADDVQLYVRDHPFGQNAISDSGPAWKFYLGIIDNIEKEKKHTVQVDLS